jgi:hypothetical protein
MESVYGSIEMAAGVAPFNCAANDADGGVGGTVPAILSVTLRPSASFGAFTPGVTRDYSASTTATVTSSGLIAGRRSASAGFWRCCIRRRRLRQAAPPRLAERRSAAR